MIKKAVSILTVFAVATVFSMSIFAQNTDTTPPPEDWDAALSANPSQTIMEYGYQTEDENAITATYNSYPAVHITKDMAQAAVDWMTNQVGDSAAASQWSGRCLAMVSQTFKNVGVNQSGYGTGPLAAQKLEAAGYLHTDNNAPAGTLVMFGVCSNSRYDPYGYGHAALSIGNGKIVHAYAGSIRIDNISTVVGHGYPYLGWAVWHAEYGNTMDGVQAEAGNQTELISNFVERLYTTALGRASDADGKANWTTYLKAGKATGAEAAKSFMICKEFDDRNLSNEEFLNVAYQTFYGRSPDASGYNAWLNFLQNGYSREGVICQFAVSDEFQAICDSYGMQRGTITSTQNRDKNATLTAFVNRIYTKLLDRAAEPDGLNAWTGAILKGDFTVKQTAVIFVESQEFLAHNYSTEDYVTHLYKMFFGREPEKTGFDNWVNYINAGKCTRTQAAEAFADGPEFAAIMKDAGV